MIARRRDDRPRTTHPRFKLAELSALVALLLSIATAAEAGPITLAWDLSPDPTVIGYVVLYGTAPGIYTGTLDVGSQTSATVRGLADGQVYFFAVQAYSASGRLSTFSNVESGATANQPPHITNPGPQAAAEGAAVALALAANDPDADPLTFTATGLPPPLVLDPSTGVVSGTIAYDAAGTHFVTVTVSDGAASSNISFQWVVANTNQPPVVIVPDLSHGVGAVISYAIPATEPDGTLMTFAATGLPPGLALDPNAGLISGTLTSVGVRSVTLTVTDESMRSTTVQFQWTVLASNAPPTLAAPGNQEGSLVNPTSLQLAGSDPDGNTLTYRATGLPPGLVLDAHSGAIEGQPTSSADFPVTVTVSDGIASATRTFTWTIFANRAPTIQGLVNQSALVNGLVDFIVQATDPEGTELTFSAVGLPSGLVLDANTGAITGAPTQIGLKTVTIFASDGTLSASQTFSWTILANGAPTLQNPGPQSSEEYRALPPFTVASSDPEGNPLTFDAAGLPPGLWIDAESGTVSGLPTLVGTYTVTITVSDAAASASQTFPWVIFPNPPPTIEQPVAQSAVVGTPVFLPISANDPNGHSFTLTASGLPPGLTLDQNLMLILGTPTTAGTYSAAQITAFDGTRFTSVSFTWTVAAGPAPFTAVQSNQSAPGGTPTSVTVPYMAPQLAGDLNVVAIGWHDSTATIASVTDSRGNSYALAVGPTVVPGVATQSIYYAPSIVAALAGENVVQVTFTGPATSPDVRIVEYQGVRAVTPVAGTAAAQGNSDLSDSGFLTTAHPTALLVAANLVDTGTTTAAGESFASRIPSSQGSLLEDRTVTALGSYNATAPVAPDGAWIMQLVAFRAVNTAPSLAPASNQTHPENAFVAVWLAGIDPDGDPLTYDVFDLPDGLGVNNDTGLIAGDLTFDTAGVHTVRATVSDGEFTTSRTFTWTVTNVNRAPSLTAVPDQTSVEHATIAIQLAGDDLDAGATLTYSATGLPASLSVHPTTGLITGMLTFTSAGTYHVTATVSDGAASGSTTFTWTVTNRTTRGDFDGDGRSDLAVYRPSDGTWSIRHSQTNGATNAAFASGVTMGRPVPGDYDGDAKADVAVYHPATGVWTILRSSTNYTTRLTVSWGASTDVPVPDDYDGDFKTDLAVYRPATGQWQILQSSTGATTSVTLGTSTDLPAPGDYDGDGKVDLAIYRPTTGQWQIRYSSTGSIVLVTRGGSSDLPVPADYDGDGKTDVAVYHPGTGQWQILPSGTGLPTSGALTGTASTDVPVPGDYDGDGRTDRAVYQTAGVWRIRQSGSASDVAIAWGPGVDLPIVKADFDGNGLSDIAVFRPSDGSWNLRSAGVGTTAGVVHWGNGNDKPVPGDYDGDGKTDIAVFRPSDGTWYLRYSSSGTAAGFQWGNGLDVPVPGDYNGDRKTDIAVFRPTDGTWYLRHSGTGAIVGVQWGNGSDKPAPGDYDGDGKTDIAVFRPSDGTWYLRYSGTGAIVGVQWGNGADKPVPGDYDGDGKTDIAVFRPSNGTWYLRYSSTGTTAGFQWGNGLDVPVPGDYDGDGKTDIAVFRPSDGVWYLHYSRTGAAAGFQWGYGSPTPVLKRP